VVSEHENEKGQILGLVKGAPEVIMKLIKHVPKYYNETFLHYASQGKRVIAMAYKKLPKVNRENARNVSRDEIESDLEFCGFLVFECPLKEDSQDVIELLTQSSHNVIMITGDNPLTACEVAKELHICKKPVLILERQPEQEFRWIDIESRESFLKKNSPPSISFPLTDNKFSNEFDMCVYGDGLSYLLNHPKKAEILSKVAVISRATPENKAAILAMLKSSGYTTLMCGDGTNDVGALKQSHVGIALLNTVIVTKKEPKEKKKEKADIAELDQGPKGTRAKRARVRHTTKPDVKPIKMSRAKAMKLKQQWLERIEEEKKSFTRGYNS
jgi:cation-transporting ATPase 13A1